METLRKMGIPPAGSNYNKLKLKIKAYNIDISHMLHQSHSRGKRKSAEATKRSLECVLVKDETRNVGTHFLKLRLWRAEILDKQCSECGITEWMGVPAPLQLDHINGDRQDNRIENLRILCPNCHAQTSTWTGKNSRKGRISEEEKEARLNRPSQAILNGPRKLCPDCGKEINRYSVKCSKCSDKNRPTKISWPSVEELKVMVEKSNYSAAARELGVSDSAIRKRLGIKPSGLNRRPVLSKLCLGCGKDVGRVNSRCMPCARAFRVTKIIWPSIEELKVMVDNSSRSAVAKELGVAPSTVRKRLLRYG